MVRGANTLLLERRSGVQTWIQVNLQALERDLVSKQGMCALQRLQECVCGLDGRIHRNPAV